MSKHDNWDEHWDRYAEAANRNPAQQMRHRLVVKLLQGKGGNESSKILDIGSGQGDLCRQLQSEVPTATLVGFELSERGVEVSRTKVPSGRFHIVDLFKPPLEAQQYREWASHAVCSEVLEHVDSPVEFLCAARVYLSEGCRMIVTVPGGPMSAFDRHIGHRQHFTRASITDVLTKAGFSVDRVYLAGFPFFNLYRLTVILRGEKLVSDVDAGSAKRGMSRLAGIVMKLFGVLFRMNLLNSPWGWQVVAVARKKSS